MFKRFEKQELYNIRNKIPIDILIEKELMIPSKMTINGLKFQCPICKEMETATNPKTNLARCFKCKLNFNPIDITKLCKQFGFVESVIYLKDFQKKYQTSPSIYQRGHSGLLSLNDIFKQIMKNE